MIIENGVVRTMDPSLPVARAPALGALLRLAVGPPARLAAGAAAAAPALLLPLLPQLLPPPVPLPFPVLPRLSSLAQTPKFL